MENSSNKKRFLIDYIHSLSERTQVFKGKINYGIDWIIYNLALSKGWTPIRLPFYRNPNQVAPKIKTETEFGIDLSFLLPNKNELVIFVLKSVELNNKNWVKENIYDDLVKASSPDISFTELKSLKKVRVILCYNKDDDYDGIKLYNNFTKNQRKKIQNNISIEYESWNLTKIVDEVDNELFNPSLLPQDLSSILTYLTSQISDFQYGTKEWNDLLIPNFKNLLEIILKDTLDERRLKIIPVVLYILKKYKNKHPSSETGWLELVEWSMLYMWNYLLKSNKKKYRKIIINMWLRMYLIELTEYIGRNEKVFSTEHSFSSIQAVGNLGAVNDSYVTYWHIARLGISSVGMMEFVDPSDAEMKDWLFKTLSHNCDLLIACQRANPAIFRPLIDINHIELYLIWIMLYNLGYKKEIYEWLGELENRLLTRRVGHSKLPFIESRNQLDLVAEYAATNERPDNFTDSSSYLLLMLMELCFSLEEEEKKEMLNRYLKRIVFAIGSDGKKLVESEIELMGWVPPKDWAERVFINRISDGIAISTNNFVDTDDKEENITEKIFDFIKESRKQYQYKLPTNIPLSVLILACLKNKSPLPAEFWRSIIFRERPRKGK